MQALLGKQLPLLSSSLSVSSQQLSSLPTSMLPNPVSEAVRLPRSTVANPTHASSRLTVQSLPQQLGPSPLVAAHRVRRCSTTVLLPGPHRPEEMDQASTWSGPASSC